MRRLILFALIGCFCRSAISQATQSDTFLMAKTRALYDSPFLRGLVSFDCAVQFDWKKHFEGVLGTVPPNALPTIDALQKVQHRLFVDASGANISAIPVKPDLSAVPRAAELEGVFDQMVPQGLNEWSPFSRNVILPEGPTTYAFQKISSGYKLDMKGPGVQAAIVLHSDMRMTSVVSQTPQPMRFDTEFTNGPDGLLLSSVKSGSTTDASTNVDAVFTYTYQTVEGFQLPSSVSITPSAPIAWRYSLTDCKVMRGVVIEVGLPKSQN